MLRGGGDGPLDAVLARQAWALPAVALLGVAVSGLEGLGIGLLVPLLGAFIAGARTTAIPEPLATIAALAERLIPGQRLAAIATLIIVIMLLKAVVQIAAAAFSARIEGRVGVDVRSALFDRLLAADYPFFLSADPGRLAAIVTTGTWKLMETVRMTFGIVSASATLLVFGMLLLATEWRLFVAVLFGLLLVRQLQHRQSARLGPLSDEVYAADAQLAGRTLAGVRAIRSIRLFGQESRERRRLDDASRRLRDAIVVVQQGAECLLPGLEVLETALFLAVLLIASAIGTPVPVLAAFLVLLYRAQGPLLTINRNRLERVTLSGAVREIEWLLTAPSGPAPIQGRSLGEINAPIRFMDVSYSFPQSGPAEVPAIQGASFVIPVGAAVALIGPSGSGKSTLVNLMCGLLQPTTGRILAGDVPLAQVDPKAWRSRIALAGQDVELIDGTVFDNIAYGLEGATQPMVEEAARIADAHTFIAALPAGYSESLGTGSLRLSGGQRQRIGLARALVRRPDLLILDEATSAVDGLSERSIMALLRTHACFRTAIVISHRRSTLSVCDIGVVLQAGRVVEAGPLRALEFYRLMEASGDGEALS